VAHSQSTAETCTLAAAPAKEPASSELGRSIVVSSLASAQQIKRDKMEISDAVVADDITRLPDFSVTQALLPRARSIRYRTLSRQPDQSDPAGTSSREVGKWVPGSVRCQGSALRLGRSKRGPST